MDMRTGTWNVRSLYNADSLMTGTREIGRTGHSWEDNIQMDLREI
jgi:hypothetical protein